MKHWTENNIEDYAASMCMDVCSDLDIPDNQRMSLETLIKVVRSHGQKLTVVVYDDGDPYNEQGPVLGAIFLRCWEAMGKPRMMDEIDDFGA